MTSVLVTGGAGYIGSQTCKSLSKHRYQPIVLDNLSSGHEHNVRWGPLVVGSTSDQILVESTIRRYNIEAVIHFAANAYVRESVCSPRDYYINNVANSISLLEAVINTGVQHFIFSSSCATYGIPEDVPILETTPCRPVSPYGETKLVVENMLRSYSAAYSLNWLALRYFNAAGADPEGDLGEEHSPETHLIPLAIAAALGTKNSLCINGTTFPTKDGSAIRDFIHVWDIAHAHTLGLQFLLGNSYGGAINLGTGQGHSVLEIVKQIETISKRIIPTYIAPRNSVDPAVLIASPDLAHKTLNWTPQYSQLHQMIEHALSWAQCNPKL